MARRSRQYLYLLPNSFTGLNMFLGLWAIMLAVDGGRTQTRDAVVIASWWIVIASLMDGLDGAIARMTRTTSNFGVQFDSLSDLVTFGVAPAVILYSQIAQWNPSVAVGVCAAFAIAGAVRLARFNISASPAAKKKVFQGLPIPAAAGLVVSLVLCIEHMEKILGPEISRRVLPSAGLIAAYLMISKMRFLSFRDMAFREVATPAWVAFQLLIFIVFMVWILMLEDLRDVLALVIFGGYVLHSITAALVWRWKLVVRRGEAANGAER